MYRMIRMGPIALLALICANTSSAQDAVGDDLGRAKEAYRAAIDQARSTLLEAVDAKLKEVAKSGNLADVKAIQSERDTFESSGKLPKSVKLSRATLECQEAGKKAKAAMTLAYDKAIKDYTRTLDIANADAVKAEAVYFKTRPPFDKPMEVAVPADGAGPAPKDGRAVWVAASGRRFEWMGVRQWREVTPDGRTSRFDETVRNADFIELQRGDGVRVRIHSSVYYWDGVIGDGATLWKQNSREDDSRGGWKRP